MLTTMLALRLSIARYSPSSPPPLHQWAEESLEVVNGSLTHCTAFSLSQPEMSTWRQQ
jgi:hypothetical protein